LPVCYNHQPPPQGGFKGEIMKIETIHESLVNGQRRQMVEQIKEYGLYDFFSDYRDYLKDLYFNSFVDGGFDYFADATISYHRITNR
jgi:hypothetical protein